MNKFDITDIALADAGKKRIEWAHRDMPVLETVRKEFAKKKPLKGKVLAAVLHVTAETANLVRALKAGGAEVFLARFQGPAGAGANVAFACDIVFAATTASFIQSFAKIGVIPDSGGTFILPRLVGLQRASAMTMLAEKIPAQQALDWGLIYKVVAAENLQAEAFACAKQLATQPTRALGLIKRAFNRSLGVSLDDALETEETLQREAGTSSDYAEGVKAFMEKRPPRFTGQ